jgi:hypothetical protein
MLIISRKKDQKLVIAEGIEITILEVGRNRVRFGINAPKHVIIQTRVKDPLSSVTAPLPDETAPQPIVAAVELSTAKPVRRLVRAV